MMVEADSVTLLKHRYDTATG